MPPRHAAALALVGWYLMLPPVKDGKRVPGVPLSAWAHHDSYDSAAECRNGGFELMERVKQKGGSPDRILSASAFECIETDDLRLKVK